MFYSYIFIIFFVLYLIFKNVYEVKELEGFEMLELKLRDIKNNPINNSVGIGSSIADKFAPNILNKKNSSKYRNIDLLKEESNIIDEILSNDIKQFSSSEYYKYENILPNHFKVHDKVEDPHFRKKYYIDSEPEYQSRSAFLTDLEKVKNIKDIDDCIGQWDSWDYSSCDDETKRCALKSREYKVIREKRDEGEECEYQQGDMEYDYCYGDTNEERCGMEENVCDCKINKIDEEDEDEDEIYEWEYEDNATLSIKERKKGREEGNKENELSQTLIKKYPKLAENPDIIQNERLLFTYRNKKTVTDIINNHDRRLGEPPSAEATADISLYNDMIQTLNIINNACVLETRIDPDDNKEKTFREFKKNYKNTAQQEWEDAGRNPDKNLECNCPGPEYKVGGRCLDDIPLDIKMAFLKLLNI